jgi:hypothetical protein
MDQNTMNFSGCTAKADYCHKFYCPEADPASTPFPTFFGETMQRFFENFKEMPDGCLYTGMNFSVSEIEAIHSILPKLALIAEFAQYKNYKPETIAMFQACCEALSYIKEKAESRFPLLPNNVYSLELNQLQHL